MPTAEIITIGTEILLGEILDTNSRYLARTLRDVGIDLFRQTTVGDNQNRIAKAILDAMESSEIIITTGGLGPTVDDPTGLNFGNRSKSDSSDMVISLRKIICVRLMCQKVLSQLRTR
jgi:molybdenum cofactor synthesis domain-containing protein